MIVQSKDGFYVVPLPVFWSYASTSFASGVDDQLVYNSEAFSREKRIFLQCLLRILFRRVGPDTMQPISNSGTSIQQETNKRLLQLTWIGIPRHRAAVQKRA